MPQTNAYTRGVKYIKIAKLDSGNVDQSLELENLTDIRIKFTDVPGVTQYNVGAINEYPTYYLYTIVPTDVTSSADQEILDYKVSGSSTTGTGANTFNITNYNINTNVLNYFTASSGYWTLGNTPNTVLSVTCSVSFSVTPIMYALTPTPGITLVDIIYGNNIYLSPVPALTGGPTTYQGNWISSASFTPIEGSQYIVQIDAGFAQATTTVYSASLLITQSVAPQPSNYDITVLEPYVVANFYNSDCNVLQNNADVNVVSPLYMDVDFTNSPIVAQNQAAILNGTAARAQVQSWNYSYFSNISGRYLGKQQNAIAVNVYTSASQFVTASVNGFTGSWPGDSTSPSIPVPGNIVIQSLDSCIYEVNWGGGGYPENTNGGGINMGNIYLVGETKDDVAIIKPGTDIYYDLLAKMFPSGSTAYQYQYSNTSGLPNQLNITYPALGLPSAKYILPSPAQSYFASGLWPGTFTPNQSGIPTVVLSSSNSQGIYGTQINNNGYLSSTIVGAVYYNALVNEISNSLSNGDKWFVSLYSGSGPYSNPTTGLGYTVSSSTLYQYGYPFEIASAYSSSNYAYITLKTGSGIYNVSSFFSGSLTTPRIIGQSASIATTGMLITKADTPTNGLTVYGVPSLNFAGTGQGYILSQYPKKVITENIDYILKTYGNKP